MKKVCLWLALASLFALNASRAATIVENFTADPVNGGWTIFGDTNLFTWDAANQAEDVTWDSSQPDSYLYLPLGTVLTVNDSFSLSFDLQLSNATGYNYSMQLAVDLFNFSEATNSLYSHADGTLPDLFEFGYFPGTDAISPSIDATLIDSNADYYFAYDNQALTPGVAYSVTISHAAGDDYVTGEVLTNGTPFSEFPIVYSEGISDFRLDTVSISSFQDDGYGDSIYAQGTIRNLVVTLPPPPVRQLTGAFANGEWAAGFLSQNYWNYSLQRSGDLVNWTTLGAPAAGTGTNMILLDAAPPATNAFYRIYAQRP